MRNNIDNHKQITYIQVDKIYPHPDNPRKDLGDLEELAESIKAKGILQNLTLVARDNETYFSIIGHRRHAAAKLAGLTEVPCVISEMDHKEQVATMLLENMQRSDLTVYEQAQGFQMMIDLGETVSGISGKTGFSETTVRRRVKLLELDQDKFKESIERGATLMDYAELEKIKNPKLKNKVLEHIGTNNFTWKLRDAIEEEERPLRKAALIEELDTFAKKIKDTKKLSYITGFWAYKKPSVWKKPKDANKVEYFYTIDNGNISLYKKDPKEEKKKQSPEEKAFKEKDSKLKELTIRAYELRYEFVKNYTGGKKHQKEILAFTMRKLLIYGRAEPEDILKMLNIEKPEVNEQTVKDYQEQQSMIRILIDKKYEEQPERILFMAAYLGWGDDKSKGYYYPQGWCNKVEYQRTEGLDFIYDTLISMGYQMSEEEQRLKDGTHELFRQTEEKA